MRSSSLLTVLLLLFLPTACGSEVEHRDTPARRTADPVPVFGRDPGPVPLHADSLGAGDPTGSAGPAAGGTLISGGLLIDGTGAPARRTDLLIVEGRIAHVGIVDPDTLDVSELVDATGLVVTPGFIDAHAHGNPLSTPGFPSFLAQGVTTIVLGQDGSSPEVSELPELMRSVSTAQPAVNVAWLVGHNTIRGESGVGFGAPGAAGLERMVALVAAGLEAGAFGLSLGLEYTPGNQAGPEELAAIARPVAARGGIVMSHMRNEDADQVEASLAELIEQGRLSGARVHASHIKIVLGNDPSQARRLLEVMESARREGVRVTADIYPYTASFAGLSILFPDWARPPNDYQAVVRNRRAELAEYLRLRVQNRNGPEATLFGSGTWSGRTLAEVARELGRPFEEVLVDLGPGGGQAAYFVMNEEVMATLLAGPHVAIASDGSPTMNHPRGYGTFPRVLRRFVVEEGLLTLEEAVYRMTGLTASILGFDDPARVEVPRGRLAEGWAADVLVFDPAELRDRADFEAPHLLAEGMRGVWVNGIRAWSKVGAPAPRSASGQVLRDHGGS